MIRIRLAQIVAIAALISMLLPAEKATAKQFTLFAPDEDVSSVNALLKMLGRDSPDIVQEVATLQEALDSETEVLVLFLSRIHYMRLRRELSPENIAKLRERKIIGIGYGAAKLFGTLGLEIKGGKCAHNTRDKQPKIHIQPNELYPERREETIIAFQLDEKGTEETHRNLDYNFAMFLPQQDKRMQFVKAIARWHRDEFYAPIVRQGNYIMVGLAAPTTTWTNEYKSFFKNLAYSLMKAPKLNFSRAEWEITHPGTYDLQLAEFRSKKELSRRQFYFRFTKPTEFSAVLQYEGSGRILMKFVGENGLHHTVKRSWNEDDLRIKLNITADDIQKVEQGYWWLLEVANFNSQKRAHCSLSIEYGEAKKNDDVSLDEFDIPEENLKIPEEMQTCTENLQKIYTAIKKYEKDKGKLPDWLSDLVPDYLSSETLFCPKDFGHKSPYSPDPKLPCSYGWQFSAKPIPPGWDPTGRTLYRDWKIQQVKLFGDIVPMVRCYHHRSKRVLNLSAGGEIWWGPLDWEYMFMPDYADIHKQTLSKAIASRPADPTPPRIKDLSEKQAAQTGDGKVNNGRLPVRVPLEHTTEMFRWGITYFRPQAIELSTNEPPQNWVLPQFFSATQRRFWAKKMFGGKTIMNVVIHTPLDPKLGEWDVFVTFDEDVDFRSTMPINIRARSRNMMEFNIDYRNGAKQPYVIRIGPNARNPGRYFLTYHRECIRTGTADILGREHKIALSDDDSDGLYSDLADTKVIIDHDADGHMSHRDGVRADSPIGIGLSEYFTIEINDEGSSALLRPAEYGILEGFVTRESSNTPVPKARVRITPHGFEALTGPDGRYEMRLPVGRYSEVQITARGYIPVHIDRVPLVSHTTTANLSVHLRPPTMPQSGEITLHDSDSYHFLSGQRGRCTGGDFYFGFSKGNPRFWANNRHQGGLVDLGQSQTPLDAVTPPMQGYKQFGVLAEVGHVYVSLAKQGEEDCHIVFRVTEIKQGDSCTLKYYYRQGETIQ